jgi:putative transposase
VYLVWITKYRYAVLKGPIAYRLRDLVKQICSANDTIIISGNVAPNEVHILVSYPTDISVLKLMQLIKGRTSRKVQLEFPELGKRYWGQHLRARGFFAVSTGNVTTEMIENYIKNHKDEDDEFKVSRL